MPTLQYTIRNIPQPVNDYLRKKARLTSKSLNQVVIDELSEKVGTPCQSAGSALAWFVGSGIDDATLQALADEDAQQKALAAKEL